MYYKDINMDKYIYSINGTFRVLQNFYNTEKFEKNNRRFKKSKDISIDNLYMTSRAHNRTIISKSSYKKNKLM